MASSRCLSSRPLWKHLWSYLLKTLEEPWRHLVWKIKNRCCRLPESLSSYINIQCHPSVVFFILCDIPWNTVLNSILQDKITLLLKGWSVVPCRIIWWLHCTVKQRLHSTSHILVPWRNSPWTPTEQSLWYGYERKGASFLISDVQYSTRKYSTQLSNVPYKKHKIYRSLR